MITDAPVSAPAAPLVFDDTVAISNGVVRLGVAPSVGRVVAFGEVDGPNLIWMATESAYDDPTQGHDGQQYYNLGGDKLWPTAQMLWKLPTQNDSWPPDGVIDGGAWQLIDQSPLSLTIQSPESPHYGVVVLRSFTLDPEQAKVTIENVIQRVAANPIPVSIWTITQVVKPETAVLDIDRKAPAIAGPKIRPLTDETAAKAEGFVESLGQDEAALWAQKGDAWAKLGTFGRWVAAVYPDVTFIQETDFDPAGAYPELSSAQVYHAGDYTELELLSPLVQLKKDQTLSNTVTWTLIDVSSEHAFPTLLTRDRR